jgi:hypothetical protein
MAADIEAKALVADRTGDTTHLLVILFENDNRTSGCRKLVRRTQTGRSRSDDNRFVELGVSRLSGAVLSHRSSLKLF